MLHEPLSIYILTNGFGTRKSGYATLSKFWKSLTNEGAKAPELVKHSQNLDNVA